MQLINLLAVLHLSLRHRRPLDIVIALVVGLFALELDLQVPVGQCFGSSFVVVVVFVPVWFIIELNEVE